MKGKILGFNEAEGGGAISAEDGSRHRFTRTDWRGDKPPVAGMAVDFESSDGAAKEIYPVSGAALAALGNINVDLSGLSASPGGARVGDMFTRSLAAPLALVVLAACFFEALALPRPMTGATLIGLGGAMDDLNMAAQAARMMGEGKSGFDTMSSLLFLRFAAPVAALWLGWVAWSGKPERMPMLVTGGAAIVAALLVVMLKSAIVSMAPEVARGMVSNQLALGFGVWLLLLAGAGLIAAGLGFIRNPLAKG